LPSCVSKYIFCNSSVRPPLPEWLLSGVANDMIGDITPHIRNTVQFYCLGEYHFSSIQYNIPMSRETKEMVNLIDEIADCCSMRRSDRWIKHSYLSCVGELLSILSKWGYHRVCQSLMEALAVVDREEMRGDLQQVDLVLLELYQLNSYNSYFQIRRL
jgi:hypothetical protein